MVLIPFLIDDLSVDFFLFVGINSTIQIDFTCIYLITCIAVVFGICIIPISFQCPTTFDYTLIPSYYCKTSVPVDMTDNVLYCLRNIEIFRRCNI